jgi:hypothetical protein
VSRRRTECHGRGVTTSARSEATLLLTSKTATNRNCLYEEWRRIAAQHHYALGGRDEFPTDMELRPQYEAGLTPEAALPEILTARVRV